MTPPWILGSQDSGNHLLMFTSLLKDMINDIPDGREAQGKICGKGHGDSMPSPGTQLSPNLHVFTNPEALQALSFWVFLWRLNYISMID